MGSIVLPVLLFRRSIASIYVKLFWGFLFCSINLFGYCLANTLSFFFFSFISQPHLQHVEVPGFGAQIGAAPEAYATARAILDQSHVCDPCRCLHQCPIFNPLDESRDKPSSSWILCQVFNPLSHNKNSQYTVLITVAIK